MNDYIKKWVMNPAVMIPASQAKIITYDFKKASDIVTRRVTEAALMGSKMYQFTGAMDNHGNIDKKYDEDDKFVIDFFMACFTPLGNPFKTYLEANGYTVSYYIQLTIEW